MPYIVDFNKAPETLLLELVNSENNATLTFDQVELMPPEVETTKLGYNTKTPILWKTTSDMIGVVNVFYNRIDLDVLFSLTGISLKEVNLDLDEQLTPIINDKFFDELHRRYNVTFSSNDFGFTGDTVKALTANADNFAYIGTTSYDIERSLYTRVQSTLLDGFTLIDPSDIKLVLINQNLPLYQLPARFTADKASAELLTIGIDCSDFQSFLELNADGSIKYFTELSNQLAAYGLPAFSNSTAGNKAIRYAVADYPDAIQSYTYVVVIESVVSATMSGRVMLHYTVAT
jgi:hypothetical protein